MGGGWRMGMRWMKGSSYGMMARQDDGRKRISESPRRALCRGLSLLLPDFLRLRSRQALATAALSRNRVRGVTVKQVPPNVGMTGRVQLSLPNQRARPFGYSECSKGA